MNRREAIQRAAGGLLGAVGAFLFSSQASATPDVRRLTMTFCIDRKKLRQYIKQRIKSGCVDPVEIASRIPMLEFVTLGD